MPTDRMPSLASTAWIAAVLLLAGTAPPRVVEAQVPRPGLDTLARFERYPLLVPDAQAHYLSSHDRTGGNDDGFDGTYSALYVDARGENVIFDVKGPGRSTPSGSPAGRAALRRSDGAGSSSTSTTRRSRGSISTPTNCSGPGNPRSPHRSSSTGSPVRAATSATCRSPFGAG